MKKKNLKRSMVLLLFMCFLFSNVAMASSSTPDIYNITKLKAYNSPSIAEIKTINNEVQNGDKFAKKIANKLVVFNDYYNKLVEKYMELDSQGLDDEQIINKLVDEIPAIIESLPEVKIDNNLETFRVIDIY